MKKACSSSGPLGCTSAREYTAKWMRLLGNCSSSLSYAKLVYTSTPPNMSFNTFIALRVPYVLCGIAKGISFDDDFFIRISFFHSKAIVRKTVFLFLISSKVTRKVTNIVCREKKI